MRIPKYGFLIIMLFSFSVELSYGYDGDSGSDNPTSIAVVDFTREGKELAKFVKITPESFKKAAVLALMSHKWKITNVTDDEVDGEIEDAYKVKIVLKEVRGDKRNVVRIYITGPESRQNWAENIRHEMTYTLVLLSE